MSKKDNLIFHTNRRMKERYGLKYNLRIRNALIELIQNGKYTFICKQSLRVSIYDVLYEVKEKDIIDSNLANACLTKIRVVYDKNRKTIITVLPLEKT